MRFIKGGTDDAGETEAVFRICEYRFSLMNFADLLITEFGLPLSAPSCAAFYYQEWKGEFFSRNSAFDLHSIYDKIIDIIRTQKVFPDKSKEHSPEFDYPIYFVAASLLKGFTGIENVEKIVLLMTGREYNFKLITCRVWLNRIIVRDKMLRTQKKPGFTSWFTEEMAVVIV